MDDDDDVDWTSDPGAIRTPTCCSPFIDLSFLETEESHNLDVFLAIGPKRLTGAGGCGVMRWKNS